MDVFLPLKKLIDRYNPLDRLDAIESKMIDVNSAVVDSMDEMTARTGDLVVDNLYTPAEGVEVTDPTDSSYTGGFQSSAGWTFGGVLYQFGAVLLGKLGVGFNNRGQLLAAAGNLLVDFRGIVLNQAHILAQLSADSGYYFPKTDDIYFGGFHVLGTSTNANGQMRFGTLSLMRYDGNVFSNGSFSDGTYTSWTATGTPTVVNDSPDGSSYAISVDNANYVSQSVTTVSGDDYVLTFYVKHVSGNSDVGVIWVGANAINLLGSVQNATNSWIKVVVLFRATASTMAIRPSSQLSTGAVWYFTGFDCQRLDTWSYTGDYDSDHLGNLEIQSLRNINIEAKNNTGWPPLVVLRNALTQLQQSTPATPASGFDALYFKSDDKLYKKNSAGTETAFAEGGGTATGTNTGDQTAASLGVTSNSGWNEVTDTWTYASASTITVPTDATLVYQKGDYLRWKQGGGYLYGTIASLTATVITIIVNTDYVVANSAITNVAYSRVANPYGFPEWFNWSPTITGFTATLPTNVSYRYITKGRLCTAVVRQQVAGTSNLTTFTITSPVVAATVTNGSWQSATGVATDNGVNLATPALAIITSAGTVFTLTKDLAGTAWTNANGKRANFTITYEF